MIPNNRIGDNLIGYVQMLEKARSINPNIKVIVELGAFTGVGTVLLADHFPEAKVYSIDQWVDDFDKNDPICQFSMEEAEDEFAYRTDMFSKILSKVVSTVEAAAIFKASGLKIDFLYIDAEHTYEGVKRDIENFSPMMSENGIIAGHDYGTQQFPGVTDAVNEMRPSIKKNEYSYTQTKKFVDTSWMYIR